MLVSAKQILVCACVYATNTTLRYHRDPAIMSAQAKGAAHVTVAVTVMSGDRVPEFQRRADELIVLSAPHNFHAVGQYYQVFDQTTDREVMDVMRDQWKHPIQREASTSAAPVTRAAAVAAGKVVEEEEEKTASYHT